MLIINTQIETPYRSDIDPQRLVAVATSALKVCQVDEGEATVVVTSDETVRSLNRQYRGVDAPTDVLAFAATSSNIEEVGEAGASFPAPDDFVLPRQETPYLGDVVISAPAAVRQARAMGHSAFEEVLLLTVHGILHLLGFDHLTPADKEAMWQKQAQILRLHHLEHVQPTMVVKL